MTCRTCGGPSHIGKTCAQVMAVTRKPVAVASVGNTPVANVGNSVGNARRTIKVPPAVGSVTLDAARETAKALTESERVAKWREANRERDNARRREYMRKRRANAK